MPYYSTVVEKCNEELKECREIMNEYNMPYDVTETILEMIIEAYFQLNEAFASGRAMERILYEMVGDKDDKEFHMKYMEYVQEEIFKFPFELEYENDDSEDSEEP